MSKYVAVLLDPPWPESGGGKVKRGADRHYRLVKTKQQIRDVILWSGVWTPADNAHMYLWATNNYLSWALWLIEELGFVYKTNFPWVKPGRPGIGQYARGQHELLLFATRGSGFAVRTDDRSVRTDALVGVPRVTDAVTGKIIHSAKPPQVYDLIDARTVPGPRLEMFARTRHSDAWDVWGDEAPNSIASSEDE
jgi:N6-adenosine-specific RNA methylase IME4